MSKVVIYNPADPIIADRVIEYLRRANIPDYEGQSNILISSSIDLAQKYVFSDIQSVNELTEEDLVNIT